MYNDLPTADRIVVIGDIHGDIGMLTSCLYLANIINHNLEWIAKPANTIVVQIGDQVDSLSRDTPGNWEKLDDCTLLRYTDKLDEIARRAGGRFISMIGNHEWMNVLGNFDYVSQNSMNKSGGLDGRRRQFSPGGHYALLLAKRPVIQRIGPILFCHAGLLPEHVDAVQSIVPRANELMYKYLNKIPMTEFELYLVFHLFTHSNSMLWNRDYLESPNSANKLDYVLHKTNCKFMVIGHNPMDNIKILHNKLWIVDIGLSRAFSNDSLEVLEIWHGGVPTNENDFKPFRILKAIKK